ncbi:hypothetical protein ABT034_26730 [Streptomyces sp. NPDC002773]|uniref:hypothetical protein n=1 Tax=Streptomyces sp. NPDC002773 TaxID=3154430 RepID=UPI00333373CB
MSDFQDRNRPDRSTSEAVAKTAQAKVSEGAGLVGGKAADVAGTAREQGAEVVGEATNQARDLVGELRDQLQGQAHTQTRNLAQNVRRLADELREMSENGKPDSSAAGVVRQLADGGQQVASRLEQRGPDGLVSDLQDFARRRPGVFLAGAALAGFAVARVGKGVSAASSSSPSSAGGTRAGGTQAGGTQAGGTGPAGYEYAGTEYPGTEYAGTEYAGTEYPGAPPGGTGRGAVPPLPTNPPQGRATGSSPGVPQTAYEDPLDTYGQSQPPHETPPYGQTPPAAPQRPTQGS